MLGRAWSDQQRRDSITADLANLRERKVAAMHRLEADLQDELRGMEKQYAARADAAKARDEMGECDRLIDEQLEALADLPAPRTPED